MVKCWLCKAPLRPDGICGACGAQQESHPGSWPEYYKAVNSWRDKRVCMMFLLAVFFALLASGLALIVFSD